MKKHKEFLLHLQRELIKFQTYTATEHRENGWESDEVETIQNVINLIDEQLK
jgi:hypothetical protein